MIERGLYPNDHPYRTVKVCKGYFEIGRKLLIEDGKVFIAHGAVPKWDLDEVIEGIEAIVKGGQDARK